MIWNLTFLENEPFMSYQRFNKGGRVAKSPFLAKSVQKSLNKKYLIIWLHNKSRVTATEWPNYTNDQWCNFLYYKNILMNIP